MDLADKLQFAFTSYDFDYSGMLSKEEVSLLLRSAVKGLCKVG
jgi:Ca2+-binding EF-hand superfamily protein